PSFIFSELKVLSLAQRRALHRQPVNGVKMESTIGNAGLERQPDIDFVYPGLELLLELTEDDRSTLALDFSAELRRAEGAIWGQASANGRLHRAVSPPPAWSSRTRLSGPPKNGPPSKLSGPETRLDEFRSCQSHPARRSPRRPPPSRTPRAAPSIIEVGGSG